MIESEIRPGFRYSSLVCRDERRVIDWAAGLAACDKTGRAGQYVVLGKVWSLLGPGQRGRRRLIKGSMNGAWGSPGLSHRWPQRATETMTGQYCHDKQLVLTVGGVDQSAGGTLR